jgi:hypothetical protein
VLTGVTTATNGLNVTGGNVGIGTDNPSDELSVVSSLTTDSVLRLQGGTSAGKGSGIRLMKGASAVGYIGPESWLFGSSNTSNTLVISQNAQANLSITSAGLVGIGITNPEKELEVSGSSSPSIRINNSDGSISADQTIGAIEFKANDGSNDGSQVTGSIESISQAAFTGQGSPSHLIFKTNGPSAANALTERLRITYTGQVGIGTDNPSDALTVYRSNVGNATGITIRNTETTSTYSHARLRLESQNGAGYGEIFADVANAGLRLGYNSSSTVKINTNGNIVLNNGSGIDFSATGNGSGTMTSELLDDYEEGTWTPTYFGSSTSGTPVYSQNQGSYTKVGRIVTCFGYIQLSSIGGMAGNLILGGLPYTVGDYMPNTGVEGGGFMSYYTNTAGSNNISGITIAPENNDTVASIYRLQDISGAATILDVTDIGNTFNVRFTVTYPAA